MDQYIDIKVKVWRQAGPKAEGHFETYELKHIFQGASFLERQIYQHKDGEETILLCDGENRLCLSVAAPILSEGDVLGCVVFADEAGATRSGEVEYKLAQSIAAFLGKHMES